MNEMIPWSNAGGRRCIARDLSLRAPPQALDQKIHRAGCAFVHLPRELSASALRLRPTALRSDFDLLALRARCMENVTRRRTPIKGDGERKHRTLQPSSREAMDSRGLSEAAVPIVSCAHDGGCRRTGLDKPCPRGRDPRLEVHGTCGPLFLRLDVTFTFVHSSGSAGDLRKTGFDAPGNG